MTRAGGNGLSYDQTRNVEFASPFRGIRVASGDSTDFLTRVTAIQLLLPQEAAFVGFTAARIHQMPLPSWAQATCDRPEVAYPPPTERRRIGGVQHRQWRSDPSGVWRVGGLRVLSPARTWFDLAAVVPADHLLAIADDVVRRRLTTASELRGMIKWARRRRGVRNARLVYPLIDAAAESPPESRVRYWLDYYGLPTPEVNGEVVDGRDWIARGDLLFREQRVVVEYDGAVHLAEGQRRYDAKRRNRIQEAGWTVVVLTADDLRNPYAMAQTVRMALRGRRRTPPPHVDRGLPPVRRV